MSHSEEIPDSPVSEAVVEELPVEREPGFVRSLAGTFRYPFAGDGLYILLVGGAFFTVADYVSRFTSILGIFIQLGVAGFIAAYARDVVRTSAMGEDKPPGWTEFSDWVDDLLVPALEFFVMFAVSFGLVIFLQFKHPESVPVTRALSVGAWVWGCLSFSIIFTAVSISDSLSAMLNLPVLLRTVLVTLPDYLLVCLFLALIIGLYLGAGALLGFIGRVPVLPDLIDRLVSVYFITVMTRSFGLYYRRNHERLGWY